MSQTTNPVASSILIGCPHCSSFVTLPRVISMAATVRCPCCHNAYSLRSVLPDDIPQLEVVTGEAAAAADAGQRPAAEVSFPKLEKTPPLSPNEKLPVSRALQLGARRRRHRSSDSGSPERQSPEPSSGTLAAAEVKSSRAEPAVRSSRSSRRHRSSFSAPSGAVEAAKIAAGALLAIPVSQLVIWWALGLDPFGLAPRFGKMMPILVPQKLRNEESSEEKTGAFSPAAPSGWSVALRRGADWGGEPTGPTSRNPMGDSPVNS